MNDEQDIDILDKETVYDGFFRMDAIGFATASSTAPGRRKSHARSSSAATRSPSCSTIRHATLSSWSSSSVCRHIWPAGRPGAWKPRPASSSRARNLADVARREALEETGCEIIGEMRKIGQFMASIGGSTEIVTVFYGRGQFAEGDGIHEVADEHEDIRVHVVPADEAIRKADEGEIENAASVIALNWLARHHASLRGTAA